MNARFSCAPWCAYPTPEFSHCCVASFADVAGLGAGPGSSAFASVTPSQDETTGQRTIFLHIESLTDETDERWCDLDLTPETARALAAQLINAADAVAAAPLAVATVA